MFSRASVILSTIGLMPTGNLLILVGYSGTWYGVVGAHPTGMLTCVLGFLKGSLFAKLTDLLVFSEEVGFSKIMEN